MDNVALFPLVLRRWWVLLIATVAAGVGGVLVSDEVPKKYSSTVSALVGPINADDTLEASGALSTTYADLAKSQSVLQSVVQQTGVQMSANDLAENVNGVSNQVTRIVTVTVEDEDREDSAKLANAIGVRLEQLSSQPDTNARKAISALADTNEFQGLSTSAQRRVRSAARRVFGPAPAARFTVIDSPRADDAEESPDERIIVLLAAAAGLILASAVLLIMEARRVSATAPKSSGDDGARSASPT